MAKVSLDCSLPLARFDGVDLSQAIAENPFDYIVVVDRVGMYLYINRPAKGWKIEDLINKANLYDFIPPENHALVHDALREVFEGGRPAYYEVYVPSNDTWYANVVSPIRSQGPDTARVIAASIMARDCSAHKRAEQASKQRDKRYRMIVESTRDGILLLDMRARTTFANSRFEQMLGYGPGELLGRPLLDFVDEASREAAWRQFEASTQGKHEVCNLSFRHKSGGEIWGMVSGDPSHDEAGAVNGVMAMITDQTERKRLANEVVRAQRVDAVGRLAGGVAHDFNNLLTSIIGFGSLLERSLQGQTRALLDVGYILEAADRASTLVRQLLAFGGKQNSRAASVDLNRIVRTLRPMLQSVLPDDVALILQVPKETCYAHVDPGQIEQVLLNLVINARDAISARGQITISLAHAPAEASGGARPRIALRIADDGCGIPASMLERVFDPFFTTKSAEQGSGLGLSVVCSIVQENGGSVGVESTVGEGTVFTLLFPMTEKGALESGVPTRSDLAGGQETVLLVENNELVRESTQRMLEALGYQALLASSCSEAIKLCASCDLPIAVAICNVIMPEMNGPELIAQLRENRPALRSLFLSGHSENTHATRGLSSAEIVLVKPFALPCLARAMRNALDNAHPSPC